MAEPIQWIVAAIAGWFLRGRIAKSAGHTMQADKATLRCNVNEAEERYLEILRREISNILLNVDPELMVSTYEKSWRYQDELVTAGKERISADLKALTLKYKLFSDFDLLGSRHFIPYSDAREWVSDDDLVERYLEISKMILLPRLLGKQNQSIPLFYDKEFDILKRTVRKYKDGVFKQHIVQAVNRYNALRKAIDHYGSKEAKQTYSLDDSDIEVFRLPVQMGSSELAIVLKQTGECGVYERFIHDDGEISERFYRSDIAFQKREAIYPG